MNSNESEEKINSLDYEFHKLAKEFHILDKEARLKELSEKVCKLKSRVDANEADKSKKPEKYCPRCNGFGIIPCQYCDTLIIENQNNQHYISCTLCDSSTTLKCGNCSGTGKVFHVDRQESAQDIAGSV